MEVAITTTVQFNKRYYSNNIKSYMITAFRIMMLEKKYDTEQSLR